MTNPVPLILNLWSLGHGAGDVSRRLGVHRRAVEKIVHQARQVGDPRAAVHVGRNGQPIGRPDLGLTLLALDPEVELVPFIPAQHCKHGHLKTPENVDRYGNCRVCRRRHCKDWRARK